MIVLILIKNILMSKNQRGSIYPSAFQQFVQKVFYFMIKVPLAVISFQKERSSSSSWHPCIFLHFQNFFAKILTISSSILLSGCLLASAFEWGYSYANWAHFNISSGKGQKNLVKFHKKPSRGYLNIQTRPRYVAFKKGLLKAMSLAEGATNFIMACASIYFLSEAKHLHSWTPALKMP